MCMTCFLSRRRLLVGGASLLAAAATAPLAAPAFAQTAPQNAISGEAALARLMEGNARYVAGTPAEKDFSAGRAARATAQHPIVAVLGCSDSRVAPELAFDQGPGDVFVVRVAGNFLNVDGLASLEFSMAVLGVPLIMVLGHTNCGAIVSTIKVVTEGLELPGHLPDLAANLKPAVDMALKSGDKDVLAAATVANVKNNVRKISEAQPLLAPAAKDKKIMVVGGVYDLATGKIGLV